MVLPLLALTWMSAVLAMTDKRSILFQILFAVFDSLEGFIIVMVHCILRREVTRPCVRVSRGARASRMCPRPRHKPPLSPSSRWPAKFGLFVTF